VERESQPASSWPPSRPPADLTVTASGAITAFGAQTPTSAFADQSLPLNARELIRAAELDDLQCPRGLSVEEAIGDLPAIPA